MTKAPDEVARLFAVIPGSVGNYASEVYPGYPGLVAAGGELRSMVWGFPLVLKSKRTGEPLKPKAVNNARDDKLDNPRMWRPSFEKRRCLIPVTAYAEAQGEKGSKTCTWLTLPDQPLFAIAGIWRDSAEWGPVYSMITSKACMQVADVHNRMPVIVPQDDWGTWLGGSAEAARDLCRPYNGLMTIDRTAEAWNRR